jgi:glucan phosphoethanolaminetransferase (alkaline phosphatase superfamily)
MNKISIKALIAKIIAGIFGCIGILASVCFVAFIPIIKDEPIMAVFSILMLIIAILFILIAYRVIFRYSVKAIKELSAVCGIAAFIYMPKIFPQTDYFLQKGDKILTSSGHGTSIIGILYIAAPVVWLLLPFIIYKIIFVLLRPKEEKGF